MPSDKITLISISVEIPHDEIDPTAIHHPFEFSQLPMQAQRFDLHELAALLNVAPEARIEEKPSALSSVHLSASRIQTPFVRNLQRWKTLNQIQGRNSSKDAQVHGPRIQDYRGSLTPRSRTAGPHRYLVLTVTIQGLYLRSHHSDMVPSCQSRTESLSIICCYEDRCNTGSGSLEIASEQWIGNSVEAAMEPRTTQIRSDFNSINERHGQKEIGLPSKF